MPRKKPQKYYYAYNDYGDCTEECKVKNSGTMIGSLVCQECQFCKGSGDCNIDPCWIKCSRINEATKKKD